MRGVNAHLEKRTLHGTTVYGIQGTDWNLVKKNDEGEYEPFASIDGYVTAEEMDSDFGVWEDREVTKGHWFWKRTVRPKDGLVQPDEVDSLPEFCYYQTAVRLGKGMGHDRRYQLESGRIVMDDFQNQQAHLETDWRVSVGNFGIYDYGHPLAPEPAQK